MLRNLTPSDMIMCPPCRSSADIMKYKVVLHESDEGYAISCPGLPGCWSQGETEDEAIRNIQEAIHDYLAAIQDTIEGAQVREVEVAA